MNLDEFTQHAVGAHAENCPLTNYADNPQQICISYQVNVILNEKRCDFLFKRNSFLNGPKFLSRRVNSSVKTCFSTPECLMCSLFNFSGRVFCNSDHRPLQYILTQDFWLVLKLHPRDLGDLYRVSKVKPLHLPTPHPGSYAASLKVRP